MADPVIRGAPLTRRGFLGAASATLSTLALPASHATCDCASAARAAMAEHPSAEPPPRAAREQSRLFPLRRPGPRRRFLETSNGAPFFLLGDTAWSLAVSTSRSDVMRYIANRKAKGFNAITFNAIEAEFAGGNGNHAPFNWYHEPPFCGGCNFSRRNEAYWRHVDFIVEQAAEADMLCLIFPAYEGYAQGNQGWYRQMATQGPAVLRDFGAWLARRYLAFSNIMWVAGGDNNAADRSLTKAVVDGIRSVSDKGLFSWHGARNTSALEFWRDDLEWLDFNAIYDRSDAAPANAAIAYQSASSKPFARIEDTYENPVVGNVSPVLIRWLAWSSALQGGTGAIYGDVAVWRFNGPGTVADPTNWIAALERPAGSSMGYLKRLYESTDWSKLIPDFSTRTWMREGWATSSVAALAEDRSFGIAYAQDASSGMTFDLRRLEGSAVMLRWYDPTSGDLAPGGTYATTNSRSFALRKSNSAGYSDWALLFEPA